MISNLPPPGYAGSAWRIPGELYDLGLGMSRPATTAEPTYWNLPIPNHIGSTVTFDWIGDEITPDELWPFGLSEMLVTINGTDIEYGGSWGPNPSINPDDNSGAGTHIVITRTDTGSGPLSARIPEGAADADAIMTYVPLATFWFDATWADPIVATHGITDLVGVMSADAVVLSTDLEAYWDSPNWTYAQDMTDATGTQLVAGQNYTFSGDLLLIGRLTACSYYSSSAPTSSVLIPGGPLPGSMESTYVQWLYVGPPTDLVTLFSAGNGLEEDDVVTLNGSMSFTRGATDWGASNTTAISRGTLLSITRPTGTPNVQITVPVATIKDEDYVNSYPLPALGTLTVASPRSVSPFGVVPTSSDVAFVWSGSPAAQWDGTAWDDFPTQAANTSFSFVEQNETDGVIQIPWRVY